jgi:hypothetical protein
MGHTSDLNCCSDVSVHALQATIAADDDLWQLLVSWISRKQGLLLLLFENAEEVPAEQVIP